MTHQGEGRGSRGCQSVAEKGKENGVWGVYTYFFLEAELKVVVEGLFGLASPFLREEKRKGEVCYIVERRSSSRSSNSRDSHSSISVGSHKSLSGEGTKERDFVLVRE